MGPVSWAGKHTALVVAFRAAGTLIAVAHVHSGHQGRFHAGDDGAAVDKAHHGVLIKVRMAVNILHKPLLALHGGEFRQTQSLVDLSSVIGDGLAQQLHRIAGKQHGTPLSTAVFTCSFSLEKYIKAAFCACSVPAPM